MRRRVIAVSMTAIALGFAQSPLQPFSIPWNDASPGVTNLQSWQQPIAIDSPWVTVSPEAHYERSGRRVRFLGVNVGAANAFPAKDLADAHAARLARFGFNGVRFHHMEAPWDKQNVLIDYSRGTSRELSAERLDRLHYFVAALAKQGIVSNINLLVSREFQPGDGLGADISRMNWKDQHILGFFDDAALELHKEFAAKLLRAPNPYRDGKPLAEDPAVAFVEIMNENGLVQKWFDGVTSGMPAVYRRQLEIRWNRWLRERYQSTDAMLEAWGATNQPFGPSELRNGDFAMGSTFWTVERHGGAVTQVTNPMDFTGGAPSLRVEVLTPGSDTWHVQVNQRSLRLERGKVYTVSFWAKAEQAGVPLSAVMGRAYGDFGNISAGPSVRLTSAWREYAWTFQSEVEEINARVNFNGFGNLRAAVSIANVRFQPGGRIGGLPEGRSLEAGNVPNLVISGADPAPTAAQRKDWIRFASAAEAAYWNEMRRYIKEDLGYQGIVFATIIANCGPNAQAGMDAMDSHGYWQHPVFPPGRDFNPTDWTVTNLSMLSDANGGTLGEMARQRVKGKPHNVTEYQHPAPNTYSSEAPLLVAAYGALQDWDSIWLFDYGPTRFEYVTGFFDQAGSPGKMANSILAALMFRRGDVAPAAKEWSFAFPPEIETAATASRGRAWSVGDGAHLGVPNSLALVSRVSLAIGDGAEGLTDVPLAPSGEVLRSDTGELAWNRTTARGVFTANTPKSKAVVGFAPADRPIELGGVTIVPGATRQGWSTIGVGLVEGESFESGGRALVIATGDQENTGMIWKDPATRNSVGDRWGRAPVLVESVPATVELPAPAARVRAWALDEKGLRKADLAVEGGSRARVVLGAHGTLWYEIEIRGVETPGAEPQGAR